MSASPLLQGGDLELDVNRHGLYRQGEMVHLTPTEFELLALLMRNQGIAVTHAKLLRSVWAPEYGTELDYLRSFVKTLRQKVDVGPSKTKIHCDRALGWYRFCNPRDESPAVIGDVWTKLSGPQLTASLVPPHPANQRTHPSESNY
jgi:DNA-binding response OmpR family regulator